ncbi:hypothetical protein NKJ28_00225 [Mesorhizobium sp. M0145]|uniref:hypothetical protein n=1 Tax=Mesorhizobium sp. M0145 TaxID=2956895 RepID=UPI0033352924
MTNTALDFTKELGGLFIMLGLLIWAILSPIGFGMTALFAFAWIMGNLGLVLVLLVAALFVTAAVVIAAERRAA